MSEPMSNREIEDVLSSIRRLVAQEGARVPVGRLILTEAQRIAEPAEATAAAAPGPDLAPDLDEQTDDAAQALEDSPASTATDRADMPAPDFGELEATIAELEAAVASGEQTWEPESEEPMARPSNVTELYGRLSFNNRNAQPTPAKEQPVGQEGAQRPAEPVEVVAEVVTRPAPEPENVEPIHTETVIDTPARARAATAPQPADDVVVEHDDDHDAPGEEPSDVTVIDEEMLRALIAQMVREELRGQLGERITQQVRKLVRAEIAKALSDHNIL